MARKLKRKFEVGERIVVLQRTNNLFDSVYNEDPDGYKEHLRGRLENVEMVVKKVSATYIYATEIGVDFERRFYNKQGFREKELCWSGVSMQIVEDETVLEKLIDESYDYYRIKYELMDLVRNSPLPILREVEDALKEKGII